MKYSKALIVRSRAAFTLLELLVATAVFVLILGMTFWVITQTSSIWQRASRDIDAFQGARQAFENITRLVSQATLNTYWDYEFDNTGRPVRYRRNSDLHFYLNASGLNSIPGTAGCGQALFFQAPYGRRDKSSTMQWTPELLNEIGFYVDFGSNANWLPDGLRDKLKTSFRYRLFQAVKPTEDFSVYGTHTTSWISAQNAWPIADNIIALVVLPSRSQPEETRLGLLVDSFSYDSRDGAAQTNQPVTAHQLPPFLQIVLIAIDERSAERLANGAQEPGTITSILENRFQDPSAFHSDIKAVEEALIAQNINSRIFTTRVQLKEAKWSEP